MTIDITTKYISDDGMIFTSEEDCIEWEKAEKVYILKERYNNVSNILGVFNTSKSAESEKYKHTSNEHAEYYINVYKRII